VAPRFLRESPIASRVKPSVPGRPHAESRARRDMIGSLRV
jgi:hypothetical protein